MSARSCPSRLVALTTLALLAACAGPGADPPPDGTGGTAGPLVRPKPSNPGQTEFTSEDQMGPAAGQRGDAVATAAPGAAPAPPSADSAERAAAPGGRMADVEEGDIYKVVGNRLIYLNTYKGFIIYDISDPKNPARLSRLPVFGYPIEMFVEGNTVYALLRDALYLTQTSGKLEFSRHNVSQLVTIDISDVANPRVLKTLDIVGQLREGVSRKVENTIYVVSYWNRWYWWGWAHERSGDRQDQAWVYSFDVSDRANPKKTGELKIFEGGAVNFYDRASGAAFSRNFSGVWISATANALMVVENWHVHASGGRVSSTTGCGYYNSDQQAVVSIIDISDPKGAIRLHTRFETPGALTDQFKQTYVHDPVTRRGTYYGIFARQGWASANCSGQQIVQNTIEAWDVTDGELPLRIGRLDFGKPNETVRGTAFDVERKVAYAITAQQIDPLYAISIADPRNMRVLSEIDGLSGDISVFRLIGDRKFLLAVGRDNSRACTGFADGAENQSNIAVSIIDVQNLAAIRLVQRQCVSVRNAAWVGSEVAWNLDQAHKMLGMHADGEVNVITVPVSYWKRSDSRDWSYDRYETAVGIMSWDLRRYDPARSHTQQTVIQNHGNFIHPNGEVRRSVLFTHAVSRRRMMANLSDTHISLADLQDLGAPRLESIVEVAPYLNEIFRYGEYIVEQVQPRVNQSWHSERSAVEFRVKRAGGELDGKPAAATFVVGQVQRAVKHGNLLVVFRHAPGSAGSKIGGVAIGGTQPKSEAIVFDLSDPVRPRLAGRVDVPHEAFPYYGFYCGDYWSGYWFGGFYDHGTSWASTAAGLIVARQYWDATGTRTGYKLLFLDLRNPASPRVTERELDLGRDTHLNGLTVDPVDGRGFYLGYRKVVGTRRENGATVYQYRDYAARWELDGDRWAQRSTLNVPGRLIRTYRSAEGERMLVTSDSVVRWVAETGGTRPGTWTSWLRLNLLREIDLGGRPAAELLDARVFDNLHVASLVADGEVLFMNGRRSPYGYYHDGPVRTSSEPMPEMSDRLLAFDLSGKKLALVYDQPTRMFNVQLMGVQRGRLFANLTGDGILVVDVSDPARPSGLHFTRTLGYATHIEFAGDDAYVASGFFGATHIDLRGLPSLGLE